MVDEMDVADNLRDDPDKDGSPRPGGPVIWESYLPREAMLAAEPALVRSRSTQGT